MSENGEENRLDVFLVSCLNEKINIILSKDLWYFGKYIPGFNPNFLVETIEAQLGVIKSHGHTWETRGGCGDPDCCGAFIKYWDCDSCCEASQYSDTGGWCKTLRLMAVPFRDHIGYNEDWKV